MPMPCAISDALRRYFLSQLTMVANVVSTVWVLPSLKMALSVNCMFVLSRARLRSRGLAVSISQRLEPRDHATALVNAPPLNVSVMVESSPNDALIGVWLSRYAPVSVYFGASAAGVARPAAVGEIAIVV